MPVLSQCPLSHDDGRRERVQENSPFFLSVRAIEVYDLSSPCVRTGVLYSCLREERAEGFPNFPWCLLTHSLSTAALQLPQYSTEVETREPL